MSGGDAGAAGSAGGFDLVDGGRGGGGRTGWGRAGWGRAELGVARRCGARSGSSGAYDGFARGGSVAGDCDGSGQCVLSGASRGAGVGRSVVRNAAEGGGAGLAGHGPRAVSADLSARAGLCQRTDRPPGQPRRRAGGQRPRGARDRSGSDPAAERPAGRRTGRRGLPSDSARWSGFQCVVVVRRARGSGRG